MDNQHVGFTFIDFLRECWLEGCKLAFFRHSQEDKTHMLRYADNRAHVPWRFKAWTKYGCAYFTLPESRHAGANTASGYFKITKVLWLGISSNQTLNQSTVLVRSFPQKDVLV